MMKMLLTPWASQKKKAFKLWKIYTRSLSSYSYLMYEAAATWNKVKQKSVCKRTRGRGHNTLPSNSLICGIVTGGNESKLTSTE